MGRRRGGTDEPLSRADASHVYIDASDQVNVFLLAGVLGPGGFVSPYGEPDMTRLRAALAESLGAGSTTLRRFSQRVQQHGRDLRWVDCRPDLGWHVRTVDTVPGPTALESLCAALMAVPLPPDRPLWELLVVPGVTPDGPGIVPPDPPRGHGRHGGGRDGPTPVP